MCVCVCVCVYFNSRNDVPRVAQRYGTIAAHTRRRASVRVVFVVFCVHMYSFAGLIRRMPLPTFSDTAITDRHSDTTISSSELTGCGYPGLLDRKNRACFDTLAAALYLLLRSIPKDPSKNSRKLVHLNNYRNCPKIQLVCLGDLHLRRFGINHWHTFAQLE